MTLHVCAHEGMAYVVGVKEWNECDREAVGVVRWYIHIVNVIRAFHSELTLITRKNAFLGKLIIFSELCIGLSNPEILFVIGGTVIYFEGNEGFYPDLCISKNLRQLSEKRLVDAHARTRFDQYSAIG